MSTDPGSPAFSPVRFWRQRWQQFWFRPALPYDLAACRAAFFAGLAARYWPEDLAAWADVDLVFWLPGPLFKWFPIAALTSGCWATMVWIWKASLLTSALGLFTRPSVVMAWLLGLLVLGLPHNFGRVNHNDAIIALALTILACSQCGAGWSVDALLRRRFRPANADFDRLPSGEFTWPIRAVWLLLALSYFSAGLAKLFAGAGTWVWSNSTAIYLLQCQHDYANAPPWTDWGAWLALQPGLCRALAVFTLAVELGYPLALVSRARWFFVPAAVLMHLGVKLVMGPTFEQFVLCAVFWIPWYDLYQRGKAIHPPSRSSRSPIRLEADGSS